MIAIFPEIAHCAARGDINHLAELTRKYFGDPEQERVDIQAIVRRIGIDVQKMPIDGEGALIAKDAKGRFTVMAVIKGDVAVPEGRFLLAHMVGHYFLHVQPMIVKADLKGGGYREWECPATRFSGRGAQNHGLDAKEARAEAVADSYAAALLMPGPTVHALMERFSGNLSHCADRLAVPLGCLKRRVADLGEKPANFLEAEAKVAKKNPRRAHDASATPVIKASRQRDPALTSQGMDRIREIARMIDKSV